jgi:four helix bundle protein
MGIQSYQDLRVWQDAMELAEGCYRLTAAFPRDELFGMTSQIRRACASIPANIAEGYGRNSKGAYAQFLKVAQGSLKELETHLILAARLGLTPAEATPPLLASCDALGRMLRSLIRSIERSAD